MGAKINICMSVVADLFACIMTLHGVETIRGYPPEDPNFPTIGKKKSMNSDIANACCVVTKI
jgi:hypothetical protein